MLSPKRGIPVSKTFKSFLRREEDKVTGYSIEYEMGGGWQVFIHTDSTQWCDDNGSGTFSGTGKRQVDAECAAVRWFDEIVRAAQ